MCVSLRIYIQRNLSKRLYRCLFFFLSRLQMKLFVLDFCSWCEKVWSQYSLSIQGPSLWFSWIPNSLLILVQVIQKMASSSMHRASSSTTSNSRNYDVFLSFRGGGDTRRNFPDHLYATLTAYGIQTFRDDEDNCTYFVVMTKG